MQGTPKVRSAGAVPAALLLALWLSPASAALLRRTDASIRSFVSDGALAGNNSIQDIQERWDKMDDFVGIMFRLACQWKHGKDVNGLAAEKLKSGEIARGEVVGFKTQAQAQNVQYLLEACGRITAKGQGKCRQSCAGRWGVAKGKRAECDQKCVTAYGNFERTCRAKADDLKVVYESKLNAAAARKQCFEGHCAELPTVWTKDARAEMDQEVGTQCSNQCTAEHIRLACRRRWLLEVDFLTPGIESACFAQGQAKICFDNEKAAVSAVHDQCAATGKGTCDSQYAKCQQEGRTHAAVREAEAFCGSRKKLCKAQVTQQCLDDHDKALEAAKANCKKADAQAMEVCVATKLEEKKIAEMSACEALKTPACSKDCAARCNVAAMTKCLGGLASKNDEAKMFCSDFWRLLHESSEVDPATGDPIVLMAEVP